MKKKFLEQSSKYMPYVLLAGLALLFVITRFWRITTLPSGVHIDEAGMAYDAWCLSQYGVDRYFKSYPLLLTNFGGGGQSALCIYTTALLFRLFGFHSFLFRVTNIFYSLLTVVFGMLILRKLYPDRPYLAIAGGYLMTILPFFILSARLAWYGLSPDSRNFHSIYLLFSLRTAIGKISLLCIGRHHRRDCFIHLFPLLSHTAIFSCFEFFLQPCSKKVLFQEMDSYGNSHGASGFTADCDPADQSVGSS